MIFTNILPHTDLSVFTMGKLFRFHEVSASIMPLQSVDRYVKGISSRERLIMVEYITGIDHYTTMERHRLHRRGFVLLLRTHIHLLKEN